MEAPTPNSIRNIITTQYTTILNGIFRLKITSKLPTAAAGREIQVLFSARKPQEEISQQNSS
jgi:hypothetical protein